MTQRRMRLLRNTQGSPILIGDWRQPGKIVIATLTHNTLPHSMSSSANVMNTEEPKPYNYGVAAQDLSANQSPDVPPDKPGTDSEEPQLEASLKSSHNQPSHNILSTTVHEEEKFKPQSSAEERPHDFRSTLQQWGEMSFEEKFKPSAGKHRFNDVNALSRNC